MIVLTHKSNGGVQLRSRNNKDFRGRYPALTSALAALPDETVVDGEVVALDEAGRPSFNALQDLTVARALVVYYVFDVLVCGGRDVMPEPLAARRSLLRDLILPKLSEPVRESLVLEASLSDLIEAVRAQGLEGLVAKRLDSRYEPGQRTGAWQKMRINRGQEFVLGGYTTGSGTFDALVFGYYDEDRLLYAGRTRSGFTPAARERLYRLFGSLESAECPFANLPEAAGAWAKGSRQTR